MMGEQKGGRRRWSRNRILATSAILLGAIAVFGDPYGGNTVTLDVQELAWIVEGEVDHVTAPELADWILRGRTDVRLIDLRDPASYGEYHIPTAENVPISGLPDHPLLRNERIVLYSGGGIHSAQAWFLLRAKGYRGVYMLLGGLDAWMDEVLFPAPSADSDAAERTRIAEVSRFFGGRPLAEEEATAASEPVPLPQVAAPAPAPVVQRKKKRKEGC